jgi:chromate transporter
MNPPSVPDVDTAGSTSSSRTPLGVVFLVALRLGLTSFGGPIAHLGYFRAEYVERRRWLDDTEYADLVGMCQFLPGPTSSEIGIAVGIFRAGMPGGFAAWAGFTMPSAIALTIFAEVVRHGGALSTQWFHGLQLAAVAVVAQALWSMARTLAPDRERGTLAIAAAMVALVWTTPATQVLVIAGAGLLGWKFLPAPEAPSIVQATPRIGRRLAVAAWALFFALLIGLPVLRRLAPSQPLALVDSFYRAGALVFGGGHVILPLLQTAVVAPGWVSPDRFIAGYGAAQAVPGPLSTFAAYLGGVEGPQPNGILGAAIALVSIFLPAFLLIIGSLHVWSAVRARPVLQSTLRGVNAAVVGLLLAALYNPVWTSTVRRPLDLALALAAFGLLVLWRLPPWLVVGITAVAGAVASHSG